MFLSVYLIAMLVGGALIAVSALSGAGDHDSDLDHEADLDTDFDAGPDADGDLEADGHAHFESDTADATDLHPSDVDGLSAWLPFASLRFWTFFSAFGGLTGSLLTALSALSPLGTAVASAFVGYAAGLLITRVIRSLRREVVSSGVRAQDFVGSQGQVLLPVSADAPGQVRVRIKNRDIDLLARTEDGAAIAANEPVLVYQVEEDGTLMVTRADTE